MSRKGGRMSRRGVRLGVVAAAVAAAALIGAGRAAAATFHPADAAQLQSAIQNAQDGDVIELGPTTYFLTPPYMACLDNCPLPWEPAISHSITIRGSTDGATVIDGQEDLTAEPPYGRQPSIFELDGSASLTISNVTLKNAEYGIDDESYGLLTLDHSTITNMVGTAVYSDGGGVLQLTNDTIGYNTTSRGYGIEIDTGDLTATNVTIANNDGYGLVLDGGTASLVNSLVVSNGLGDCRAGYGLTAVASLDSDGSCSDDATAGFSTALSPNLGPLAANGGLAATMGLEAGSDAIGAGEPALCPTDDERGFLRVVGCDVGAFQANGVKAVTDTTPPVVSAPDPLAVDATGPEGARVGYTATASDPDDQAGPVSCDPASGSIFPIGTTTVTCSSTDTNGNTGTAQFTVHVRGAAEQLDALAAYVDGPGPGTSLAAHVRAAQAYLAGGDVEDACSALAALAHEAAAQRGKTLSADQADAIDAEAGRIRAVLGCA